MGDGDDGIILAPPIRNDIKDVLEFGGFEERRWVACCDPEGTK